MKKNLHFKTALSGSPNQKTSKRHGQDVIKVTGQSPSKRALHEQESQTKLESNNAQNFNSGSRASTEVANKIESDCQPLLKTPDTIVSIEHLKQSTILIKDEQDDQQ